MITSFLFFFFYFNNRTEPCFINISLFSSPDWSPLGSPASFYLVFSSGFSRLVLLFVPNVIWLPLPQSEICCSKVLLLQSVSLQLKTHIGSDKRALCDENITFAAATREAAFQWPNKQINKQTDKQTNNLCRDKTSSHFFLLLQFKASGIKVFSLPFCRCKHLSLQKKRKKKKEEKKSGFVVSFFCFVLLLSDTCRCKEYDWLQKRNLQWLKFCNCSSRSVASTTKDNRNFLG